MKYILTSIPIIITTLIWGGNIFSLRQVTALEKELKVLNERLEDSEKELDKKIMEYDNKLDLSKIKSNMEKKNMEIASDITFFEIGE